MTVCYNSTDKDLDIKVDVEELKPKETNMPNTTIPTESGGCQEVQYQRAPDMLPTEGSVSQLETGDLQEFKERVLCSIADNYIKKTPPQSMEGHDMFEKHLSKIKAIITCVRKGSLVITVKCESLQILEKLWSEYSSGRLGEVVQKCFVTEKILKEFNLSELKLKTTMDVEEYNARKVYFERVAHSSQSYFRSSEGHEPHLERRKQEMEVVDFEKMKGNCKTQIKTCN